MLDLARGFRKAGEEVAFFLLDEVRLNVRESAFRAKIERNCIPIHLFPIAGRFSPSVASSVRDRFVAFGGDVLHITGYKAALHALISGVRPVVATVHGWLCRPDLKERFYEGIERFCLCRFDRVVCLSRYYEHLLLRTGIQRERLVRIPTGLDLEALPDPALCALPPPDPFTVLHAGRFSEEKNHDLLLRATARLVESGIRLRVILAGDGPLRPRIERRIVDLDLTGHVQCVGFVPIAELLPQAHVLVLCSKIENLPMSILEAMAWMRPVIATRVGGIPDLVEHGRTGLLVHPDQESALAVALRQLIDAPDRGAEMGRAGRNRLECDFALSKNLEALRAVYHAVARRPRT